MKRIYQNFDGLEVSFQCSLPGHILDALAAAKIQAQESRQSVLIRIGENDLPVMVAESGAKGGYTYRLDTDLDGATWFVAHSLKMDNWNVRVSAKSLMLALHGYEETKNKILKMLCEDLEAVFPYNLEIPKERVSRFDYCIDFISEDFCPAPDNFITHNKTKTTTVYKDTLVITGRSRQIETITAGKMPNRQLCLYDKKAEINARSKEYWWKIWGIRKEGFNNKIWRVEIRAGKKELNKWPLKSFADFEKKAGDVIISILKSNRYVIPNENDKNCTRWKMADFWLECIAVAKKDLNKFISNTDRNEVISDYRENLIHKYEAHINGVITSYSVVLGSEITQLPGVLDLIASDFADRMRENPQKFQKRFKKASDKFIFLNNENKNPKN